MLYGKFLLKQYNDKCQSEDLHTYKIRFSTIGNMINPIRKAIRLIQVS